jgi:hypothetical protein
MHSSSGSTYLSSGDKVNILRPRFIVALLLFIVVPSFNVQAAGPSVVVTGIVGAGCVDDYGAAGFYYTASNLAGGDYFDVDFTTPGGSFTNSPAGDIFNGSGTIAAEIFVPTQTGNWSMTMKLIFKTAGGTVISTTTLNFFCDLSTGNATVTIGGGGGDAGPARFTDGRLNDQDYGQSAAVYCENGGITVYGFSGKWGSYLAFKVSKAQLAKYPEKPAQNTLIKKKFGIRLYKLTSGEYQVNAVTDEPGKEYSFRWAGCPTS